MLSYRHGYHAGNPADVFKHTVLIALVRALQEKSEGISFIDTHAGAALYDLDSGYARKNREFAVGIGQLWDRAEDGLLGDYLAQVRAANPDGRLRWYPGSPALLQSLLRTQDRLTLCELHPTEQATLTARYARDRQVRLHPGDGYAALRALLPPATRRALVLIDPSYEMPQEIEQLQQALQAALQRFANGVYVIWYPVIEDRITSLDTLPVALGLNLDEQWLDLRTTFPPARRLGRMTGAGMAIINCPWRARTCLQDLQHNWNTLNTP